MKQDFSYDRVFVQLVQIGRIEDIEADLLTLEQFKCHPKSKAQILRAIKLLYSARHTLIKDLYTYEKGGDK